MLTIRCKVSGRRIVLVTPFAAKEMVKQLGGRRWHDAQKVWSIPATPESVGGLVTVFKGHELVDEGGMRELWDRYDASVKAREHRDAEVLPPLPDEVGTSRERSWLHQRQAFAVARAHEGFLLSMGMGTGKTRVAVNLLDEWGAERVIVLCPDKVPAVWPAQVERWSDRPWHVAWHGGLNRRTQRPLKNQTLKGRVAEAEKTLALAEVRREPFMVVVPYSNCWQEPMRSWLVRMADAGVDLIMDESHNAKAPGGKWAQTAHTLGRRATHRLLLTGTVMPHSKLDLYAQARVIDEGLFGTSVANFKARYLIYGGFEDRKIVGSQNDEEFTDKLASFSFIVDTDDVLDLPEYHHLDPSTTPALGAELEPEARRIYDELENDLLAAVDDGVVTAANALSKLLRLAQVASGHAARERVVDAEIEKDVIVVGDEKHSAVKAWLESLPADEPVVLFCRFKYDLARLRSIAAELGRPYGEVSGRANDLGPGGTFPEDRIILGVQIQAGGEGIDLTRARYCGYVSTGFDNGKYMQSLRRVHRPGQTRPTTYVHFLVADTTDEVEYRALRDRQDAIRAVLDAAKRKRPPA